MTKGLSANRECRICDAELDMVLWNWSYRNVAHCARDIMK